NEFESGENSPSGVLRERMAASAYLWHNYETFPASEKTLDYVLDVEADRMVNASIARRDLDAEMTVVRNEFESGENSPSGVLRERMAASAYLWHNYETFPASEKTLDYVLDVEADRMVNASIARRDLDAQMSVVRNEFESGENSPSGVLR